jgi:hypothetical protein
MLGGGPTSQHPQWQLQQIRGVLPRAVTSPSSRYPQLLCISHAFSCQNTHRNTNRTSRVMLNDARTRALFINLKPRR